jgi:hypothetical protein
MLMSYKPITPSEKFRIATLDSFDRGQFQLLGDRIQLDRGRDFNGLLSRESRRG